MSIRPIDYVNTISKSQEVSKARQVENDRVKVQMEQGFVQQDKQIKHNIKKVRNTSKTENLRIDAEKRRESKNSGDNSEQDRKNKKKKNKDRSRLGRNIDIKI